MMIKYNKIVIASLCIFAVTSLSAKRSKLVEQDRNIAPVAASANDTIYQVIHSKILDSCQKSSQDFLIDERKQEELAKKGKFKLVIKQHDEYTVSNIALQLFGKKTVVIPTDSMSSHCVNDFSLVGSNSKASSVARVITEHMYTTYAKMFATGVLLNPTSDVQELQRRQALVKACIQDDVLRKEVLAIAKTIQKTENNFVNFFEKQTPLQDQVIESYYWMQNVRGLRTCATSPAFHGLLQFVGRGADIAAVSYSVYFLGKTIHIVPELVEIVGAGPAAFGVLVNNLIGTFFLKSAYNMEVSNSEITCYLHEQLNDIALMLRSMKKIDAALEKNSEITSKLQYYNDLKAVCIKKNKKISKDLRWLIKMLSNHTFKFKPAYISLKGRVLAAHKMMKTIKEEFATSLHALGEIESYCAIAELYKQHEGTELPYTFVEYVQNSQHPVLALDDMWNPLINVTTTSAHKIVKNSITLGAQGTVNNVIITGPNAGGKSTFMKGVGINVVLAQTFGIASAKTFVMTPFDTINSYMNIVDDLEKGQSLFKAEVARAHTLLESIINLDEDKFAFSVIDEMFSGTSPKEGEAATYSVAKKMGTRNNSVVLLATHFQKLKHLAGETKNFKNCQVRVIRNADGTITYPFKLQDGFADQNVAFDILKQEGFSSSILDDAQDLLDKHTDGTEDTLLDPLVVPEEIAPVIL